jgi:uncharacterized membrane protein
VRAPPPTPERRQYEQAVRDAERRRREHERDAREAARRDAERAKAAIWED